MAENSFNRALREVVSGEFSNIPLRDEEILHTFSNVFLRKMDKLTKAEKNRFWQMTNTAPKRIAVIMASLMIILLTACSIPSVRAAVVSFMQETHDTFVRFFTGDTGTNQINEHYFIDIKDLPDGFTEIDVIENATSFVHVYQNNDGDKIILSQSISTDYEINIDNEHGKLYEITVSGMNVSVYEPQFDNFMAAVWLNDGYAFELTFYGDCDNRDHPKLCVNLQTGVE